MPLLNYFLNVIIPFFFYEFGYVLLAFLFVVLLETMIVKLILKQHFLVLFKILLYANFLTTIVGYFLQGIIRLVIAYLTVVIMDIDSENPLLIGLVGNVGFNQELTQPITLSILITLFTSILIAFIISIVLEKKILIKRMEHIESKKKITICIVIANLLSYTLLFFWIYCSYLAYAKS